MEAAVVRLEGMLFVGVVLAVAGAAIGIPSQPESSHTACSLHQEWSAGDVYNNESLTLQSDGRGRWVYADRHGTRARISFRYSVEGDVMTIDDRSTVRSNRFALETRPTGCTLRFDESPMTMSSYLEFYGDGS